MVSIPSVLEAKQLALIFHYRVDEPREAQRKYKSHCKAPTVNLASDFALFT